jgi:hypothetical protein
MTPGHVYILMNAAIPGLLKIGKTTRTPEERAEELSRTPGVPAPFHVAYAEDVPDCDGAEKMIHSSLDKYRENNRREFFRLPLRDAVNIMRYIASTLRQAAEERQKKEQETREREAKKREADEREAREREKKARER